MAGSIRILIRSGRLDAGAIAWFTALALIVAGPLLGNGYLFLLDWVSGPEFPKFQLVAPPSGWAFGNGAPLNAAHVALRDAYVYLPDKLFLVAPVLIGGVGLFRFVRGRLGVGAGPAIVGATLYVVNPFVIDRYLAGHLHFLVGYALLPWALGPLFDALRQLTIGVAGRISLWILALSIMDVHVAGLYAVLVVVVLMFAPNRFRVVYAAVALGWGALLSSFWLLPALVAAPGSGIQTEDLALYASRPQGFQVLPTLLAMYGFWRDEFVGPAQRLPTLYFLLIPILGLVVAGIVRSLRTRPHRRFAAALIAASLTGLLLAGGTAFPPTAPAFQWLFEHIFYFRVYREPQKFLALLVLTYGIFIAGGMERLGRWRYRDSPQVSVGLTCMGLVVMLAYGFTMLWGLWGQVHLSSYPEAWHQAKAITKPDGRILVLPWERFAVWSFSDGRIVANPALSFFSPDVLTSDEAGFGGAPLQSSDPFSRYVSDLLNHRRRIQWFGHLVAPLSVRYVAWLREADHAAYSFLERQRDLDAVYRADTLVIFENTAWRGYSYGVQQGRAAHALSDLVGSGRERLATTHLYDVPPLVSRIHSKFDGLAELLAVDHDVSPPGEFPFLLVAERCTDGWKLGDASAHCHLGAVAAFSSPLSISSVHTPISGLTFLGYIFTVTALGGTIAILWRSSMRRRHPESVDRPGPSIMTAMDPVPADESRPERKSMVPVGVVVAVVVAMLLVIASAVSLFTRSGQRTETEPPAEGLACSHLELSRRLEEAGDEQGLRRAIRAAATAAERALDVSGQEFGMAEEAALNLLYVFEREGADDPAFDRWLQRGLQACEALSAPPGAAFTQAHGS